jgi:hypothetical protein
VEPDISQVSSNVKIEASGSSETSMNLYKNTKHRISKDTVMTTSYRVLSVKGIYALFIEHIIYVKKESNSGKEKAVFIKFKTACVGRFYYPPHTSDLVDPSLRLALSITRNEAERTPMRRDGVLVSNDKNLHTAHLSADLFYRTF